MDACEKVIFIYSAIVWCVFVIGHYIAVQKDEKVTEDDIQNR